jgi:ATP-dependent DNA ligase
MASRNQIRRLPGPGPPEQGKRKVVTRNGLDWTKRFSVIAGALDLPGQAILYGEVVVVIKDGQTNFSELQAELAAGIAAGSSCSSKFSAAVFPLSVPWQSGSI